jgi:O-antigen/teichoic acid export membrane protein
MTTSRSVRAFRSTLVVSGLGYAAQLLSLAAIPIFLRTVGAEGYGMMVTVLAFMGYLGFADAGLSWGSVTLVAQSHGRGRRTEIAHIVRHSIVLAACSGMVVAAALASILLASSMGWRLPMFAHHPEADRLLLIGGVQLALNLQFGVVYGLFQGLQEAYWTYFYQGLGRILGMAGAVAAALLTRSVAAMMLAQLAMVAACGVAAAVHACWRHPWAFTRGSWFDRLQYVAQLRIGAKNFMLQIGRTLSGTAPTMAISSVLGPAMVPFYTVPMTLLSMFFAPINSWNASLQSAYGEAWESGDRDWVRGAFRLTLERAVVLAGLGNALFLALGDRAIRLWTHDRLSLDFATAASVAAITTVTAFTSAGQFLLCGLNRHRRAAFAEISNGVIAMFLVYFSVRLGGLWAAGFGAAFAAAVTSGWVLRREVGAELGANALPENSFIFRAAVAAVACAGAAVAVSHLGEFGGFVQALLRLGAAGLAGSAAFAGVALALGIVAVGQLLDLAQRLKSGMAAPVA